MTRLPQQGLAREPITAALARRASLDSDWRHGRVPLYVFLGEQDGDEFGRDAFMQFFAENALGAGRPPGRWGR
jgi:sphinganine-1-phosphate aldolase